MLRLEHESNVDILRQAAVLLERENKSLVQKNLDLQRRLLALQGASPEQLAMRIAELEQQLATRNHALFGDRSEKQHSDEPSAAAADRKPRTGHGPRAQVQLPVVEQVHDLDAADRVCTVCGGHLDEWEGQTEESEEIDVVERHFVLKKHLRKKYRCSCGACIETAPAPPKLIEGGRYSIDFAIEVAVQKYLDHLPLEGQVRIMAREGLAVDSQTLWDQINALAKLLRDLPERIRQRVLSQHPVFADETTWRLMTGKRGPPGDAGRWYVWSVGAPDAVYYRIQKHRSAEAAEQLLGGYSGVVMCDGYGAYGSLAKNRADLVLAHCWAHVRRKYLEVEEFFPVQAKAIVGMIAELYAVESACPAGPAGDEIRRQLRDERSRAIVQRIRQWALTTPAMPESGLGKATAYMSGLWSGLTRFLDDPRIPLDNNLVERALRDPVMGRKNHFGSKSKRGLEVAGLYYTVLHTAKLVGVDPKAYLRRAVNAARAGETIPLPHEIAS